MGLLLCSLEADARSTESRGKTNETWQCMRHLTGYGDRGAGVTGLAAGGGRKHWARAVGGYGRPRASEDANSPHTQRHARRRTSPSQAPSEALTGSWTQEPHASLLCPKETECSDVKGGAANAVARASHRGPQPAAKPHKSRPRRQSTFGGRLEGQQVSAAGWNMLIGPSDTYRHAAGICPQRRATRGGIPRCCLPSGSRCRW